MSKDEQDAAAGAPDTEMTDISNSAPDNSTKPQTKRKSTTTKKQTTLSQFTIRNPTWSYIHLCLIPTTSTASSDLDALTARLHLQAALSSFLGLHGTAIPIDFLKIENRNVWFRVPREDASAVVAAVGGWVGNNGEGWRVMGWGCWGPGVVGGSGMDLFDS